MPAGIDVVCFSDGSEGAGAVLERSDGAMYAVKVESPKGRADDLGQRLDV